VLGRAPARRRQDAPSPSGALAPGGGLRARWQRTRAWLGPFLTGILQDYAREFAYAVLGVVWITIRATGVTVQTGQTGVKFSFGRFQRTLEPGFHLMIPFLQIALPVPTRSRTLDLPAQRVTTFDGLVYEADANLVFRIVDARAALVEIDDLDRGMVQMLGLGVQEVLRAAGRERIARWDGLDGDLERNLARRLEPWGVRVEQAGFTSVTPSAKTLRVTQLRRTVGERWAALQRLDEQAGGELHLGRALALVGTRRVPISRTRRVRFSSADHFQQRRLRVALVQAGYSRTEIRAARALLGDVLEREHEATRSLQQRHHSSTRKELARRRLERLAVRAREPRKDG
jgi:hypothetical protein